MYEANPLAFITEKAGGIAISGENNIWDIIPRSLHQRTPLILGNKDILKALFLNLTATNILLGNSYCPTNCHGI